MMAKDRTSPPQDGVQRDHSDPRERFSGKFLIRVPKALHRDLVTRAEQEALSLNAWVTRVLAKYGGLPKMTNQVPCATCGYTINIDSEMLRHQLAVCDECDSAYQIRFTDRQPGAGVGYVVDREPIRPLRPGD